MSAVRKALGDDPVILVDANTGYTVEDARKAMPGLDANGVGWLEEPFPAPSGSSRASDSENARSAASPPRGEG